jgi:hypothetical protein
MKSLKNLQKQWKIKTGTRAKRVKSMEEKFSLSPSYSFTQLQKINAIRSKSIRKGQRKIRSAIFPVRKQMMIKDAFNQEVIQ